MFEVFREESFGDYLMIEYKQFRLEKPSYAVVALPDAGLVGVIGAWHIIKSLKLDEVGGIDSYSYLPPVAVISGGTLRAPIRAFAGSNVLVVYTEFMSSVHGLVQLSKFLANYMERKGVDYVFLMSGLPIQNRFDVEKVRTYCFATSSRASDLIKDLDVIPFTNGFFAGSYAILLKEFARSRIDTLLILTESYLEFPDPEASARNVELFSKITGKSIDVKELLEEAELIRLRARDAMKSVVRGLAGMRKDIEQMPPFFTM